MADPLMTVARRLGEAVGERPLRPLPVIRAKVTHGYRPGVFPSCVLCGCRPWDCNCDPDEAQQALLAVLLRKNKEESQ